MMTYRAFLSCILLLFTWLASGNLMAQDSSEGLRQEESEDYFKKWLDEDVKYIITDEEQSVFKALTTEDERERFVEQFWYRRDPDPRTMENEFKEEHYRRIAYANERFQSGVAGWTTDRGRIYITHGPPDQIIAYPSGGRYIRKPEEGGGATATYPFEVWRYRHIEGMYDQEIELEFVDASWAGQYKLVMDPDEKDALMRVPLAGYTLAESLGLAKKMDRPYFQPGMRGRYPLVLPRAIDSPFARYERLVQVQNAEPIRYTDLREIVNVDMSFDPLPFEARTDYFSIDQDRVLVPITVEVENKDLSFELNGGLHQTKLAVYGIVTSITNRVITEFDEDLSLGFTDDQLSGALQRRSSYQRLLLLDRKMRYRLDLVVKDTNSGNVGVTRLGLAPPSYTEGKLTASSLVLSDVIVPMQDSNAQEMMFVLGDIKVRPSVKNSFGVENPLGLYLQLYELGIDQSTQSPSIETHYEIIRGGETVVEVTGGDLEGLRVYTDQRAALIKVLPTDQLEPGRYQLRVEVRDLINGGTVEETQEFLLVASSPGASAPSG
ncbi:MAG: GWxTD domain-containing protein [Acidobacteriota bacterium]|nr:MAG: GWxTD domain-containing protein [Acidobacteriota bacterium]